MARLTHVRSVPIKMTFDLAMPLEALILTRLNSLPARRRQDWLRSLIVSGFSAECAQVRRLQQDESAGDRYVPTAHTTNQRALPVESHVDQPQDIELPTQEPLPDARTPFAALRAVVG